MKKTIFGQKCIIYDKKTKKILILKRTNYKDDKDLWDMVGGSVEFGEDSKDAIRREAKEETNLNLSNLKILDIHSKLVEKDVFFIFALYFCDSFESEIKLSHEHSQFKFISIQDIDSYSFRITTQNVKHIIKEYINSI